MSQSPINWNALLKHQVNYCIQIRFFIRSKKYKKTRENITTETPVHKGFQRKQLLHLLFPFPCLNHLSLQICYGHETNGKLVSTNFRQSNHVTDTSFKCHFGNVSRRLGETHLESSTRISNYCTSTAKATFQPKTGNDYAKRRNKASVCVSFDEYFGSRNGVTFSPSNNQDKVRNLCT